MADAPSVGGGKIRSRRSNQARKPYSRAKSQHKSLFSRVTDSVKSLLNPITPNWLTNRFNQKHGVTPMPWAYEQTSNSADIPSTSDSTDEPSASTNNNYKQMKLARPAISTSTSSSSLQMYITPPDTPKCEMTPPLSGKQGLLKQFALNKKQQESLRNSLTVEQTQPLKLVDAKTYDDVSIESSSGCSSSIQTSQKTNTPEEDGVGPKNLWSASPISRSSGKASRPCQQPTMSSSKRPRFNPSIFGVSAMTYPAQKDSLNSTFYTGPIQFGGANATARVPYFATPYKVPTVTKVKVHHVHQRTPRPKTTSTASSKQTLDDTMSSGMSSTARKILQTLEKMSSPLNDARRIPSIRRTPTFYAAERRSRRTFGGSSLSDASFKGPPTAGLSTPYAAKVRKRVSMPLNNSLLTRTAQKLDEDQRQTVFDARSTMIPDSRSISTRGVSAPIASLSSSASMPRNSSGSRGGGKIKNMKKSTAHYSASHDELEEEAPDLPAVSSLPLTGASNLPSFNFGKSMVTSTPAARNLNKEDNKGPLKPEFNFASPVVKTTRMEQIPTAANTPQFQFSSPTKKSSLSDAETPKPKSSANFNPGDNAGKSSLMFAPDPKVVSSLRAAKQRSSPSSPIDTPETQGGGFKTAAKLKIGSVMDLLGDSSKKSSDKQDMTATSPKEPAPSLGLLKQIKKGWECDTCLVRNNSDAGKCIACETPRPGDNPSGGTAAAPEKTLFSASLNVPKDSPFSFGVSKKDSRKETGPDSNKDEEDDATSSKPLSSWGAAFKKPSGNWECGSCLVSNDSSKTKCVACETPKPGADTSATTKTTWGSQFKKPSGNWECATCLLSNDTIKTKCVACETPKPGAKIETQNVLGISAPKQSQFKFGLSNESSSAIAAKSTSSWGSQFKRPAATWECEVCMVVNMDDRRSCQACESPKPGTEKEEKFNKSFKFGKTSPGLLKFAKPEVPEADKTTEEKKEDEKSKTKPTVSFGLSQKSDSSAPSKPPTFSFGVPTKETTTSKAPQVAVAQSSSDKSDKPKTPSFNFGVPQKAQTEPAEKKKEGDSKPSEVKSFKPQAKFSFGAPDKSQETQAKEKESAPPTFTFSAPPTSSISTGVSSSQITAPSGFTFGKTPAQAPPAFGLSSSEKPKAPVFDTVPSSQSSAPFGSAVATQSGFAPTSAAVSKPPLYGGFNASKDVKSVENKASLPSFSFGNTTRSSSTTGFQFPDTQAAPVPTTSTATMPQSAGFSFGGNTQNPATTSSLFGSGSQPSSNISAKPPGFTGFGTPSSNPPVTQASGFSFTSSLQSGPGSVFGTAPPNVAPFGNSSQSSQSIFGNTNPTSDAPAQFGPSSTSGSMFGTPNSSSTNAGLPKPSFAFGANTEQKAPSAFTGFNFNAATPTNNTNPTGGSSGFAFGATPNKPPGAFNPSSNASTPFQFNSPAPQQQQSNGLFKFGGSNVAQPNVTTENNKSGMFVFGGSNKPETNTQQVAPVGFNFGAAPSAGPTFNFGGTAAVAPQPASNMFSAAPNQNLFNAGPGQSATPGKRVIRQARRKLRK